MFVTLTLLLTLAAPPAQIRRLYIEHLEDEALRDAATIVRASESLTDLFASWSGSKLTRQEFDRLAGQRLELIRKSSRHLSENPLVARIDRVKKPDRKSESGNASESSSELSLEEIPSTLDQIAQKARMVRKRLEQLTGQALQRGSGRAGAGTKPHYRDSGRTPGPQNSGSLQGDASCSRKGFSPFSHSGFTSSPWWKSHGLLVHSQRCYY